jgi:hypothetical protein
MTAPGFGNLASGAIDWNQVIRQPHLVNQIILQAMGQPRPIIGQSPEDEQVLVAALCAGELKGQTHLKTLNAMHGVGYPALKLLFQM